MSNRHDGVSCDACLKGNFKGKRFKCLKCYDYDLCANCYETHATSTRHAENHPMQCILTKTDLELYFGGEPLPQEQALSYTCPYCGVLGFTDVNLHEHVTSLHSECGNEVVCPLCATQPGGDANFVTDEFISHLATVHQSPREFDEPFSGSRHMRRISHSSRGLGRGRRTTQSSAAPFQANFSLSAAAREAANFDPIAELLSQLSNVRGRGSQVNSSVSSRLQQLEMQLQNTRQQLERLPRRAERVPEAPISVTAVQIAGRNSSNQLQQTGNQSKTNDNVEKANSTEFILNVEPELPIDTNIEKDQYEFNSKETSKFLLDKLDSLNLNEDERNRVLEENANAALFLEELLINSVTDFIPYNSDENDSDLSFASTEELQDIIIGKFSWETDDSEEEFRKEWALKKRKRRRKKKEIEQGKIMVFSDCENDKDYANIKSENIDCEKCDKNLLDTQFDDDDDDEEVDNFSDHAVSVDLQHLAFDHNRDSNNEAAQMNDDDDVNNHRSIKVAREAWADRNQSSNSSS